jgi:hypothetical protein
MAREITLTRGYAALVDDEDYERLSAFKWHAFCTKSGRVYAKTSQRDETGRSRDLLMHRLVLDVGPSLKVDHIEGIGLDNRRANLRPATHQQNLCNRLGGNGASSFVGVARCRGRWRAYITTDGRQHHLGVYDTPEEAAAARDRAAPLHHGSFATLNAGRGARTVGSEETRRLAGGA